MFKGFELKYILLFIKMYKKFETDQNKNCINMFGTEGVY